MSIYVIERRSGMFRNKMYTSSVLFSGLISIYQEHTNNAW